MRRLLLCLLALAWPLPAQETGTADAAWSESDYARFTPDTFRRHAPAQRVLDRASFDHALMNAALFFATNAERAKHGLPPFRHSAALTTSAAGHSRDMALQGFFNHENPKNPARRTAWQRMAAEGVSGGTRAENIAKLGVAGITYLACADEIVKMWMNSRGHRANILSREVTALGCGAHPCTCPKLHVLATQNFSSNAL